MDLTISIETLRIVAAVMAIVFSVLTGSFVVAGAGRVTSIDGFRFLAMLGFASEEARERVDREANFRIMVLRGLILRDVAWGISIVLTSIVTLAAVDEYLSQSLRTLLLLLLLGHGLLVLFRLYSGFREIAYPPEAMRRGVE